MIKALEIKVSMLFNLDVANKAVLICFLFFFLIIDSCFSLTSVVAQFFNPIAELVISIGMPSKESKTEIEIHLVTVEPKIRKYSM